MMPLSEILKIDGWMNEAELKKLAELCKGKRVLEIGSYKGRSSCAIANVATEICCLDTFKAGADGQTQDGDTLEDFKRNTKSFANLYLPEDGMFEEKDFDVVFIDGMHTADGVAMDVRAHENRLKADGLFIFHDYEEGWPGVVYAVDLLFTEKPKTMKGGSLAWIGKDKLK